MTHPLPDKLLLEAIDRIARTPDGRMQYLWLQRKMMEVRELNDPCALSADHGERRFAARLLGLMATGISESGGRTSSSGTPGDTEQPIVLAVPQPVDARGTRGAGRRITEHTFVPGWDREPDDTPDET
jgi:hypothetical protein